MYLKTLEICVLIYRNVILQKFLLAPGLAWQAALKKAKVKLDLLTDIDLILGKKNVYEEEYVTLFIDMKKLITNT